MRNKIISQQIEEKSMEGFEKERLPEGWSVVKIKHISELIGGGTPSRKNLEYFSGNIIWLTPTEIPKYNITEISNSREKITESGLRKSSAKLIPQGAVLLTSRASIGYVAIAGTIVTTNQGFASFVCNNLVFNYYLAYWLWGNRDILEENATGTTFKEIPKSKLKELRILLPPFNEQKHIVSKIESIFAQIDACKQRLEALQGKGPASLASLKSSVLKQAFEGKLVSQYPNDEPAEVMLQKLHKDKELQFEKKGLPEGWIRTNLENCVTILDSRRVPINSRERAKRSGDVPYYGATGQVGLIDDYLFDEDLILLGEDGAPFLDTFKDKAYMISGKSWVNNHAHVLRGMHDVILNNFLCYFLNQFNYKDYVTGTTRLKLNQSRLKMIQILLPSLQEQHRIVSKIESIFARIDAVDKQVKLSLKLLDMLKSSTLKQAFEGRLVPQNPNDEPAYNLLESIRGVNNVK